MESVANAGVLATAGFSSCLRVPSLSLPCWLCTSVLLILNNSKLSKISKKMETNNDIGKLLSGEIKLEMTLALVKPDAVDKLIEIEDAILRDGFTVLQKQTFKLSPEKASEFYDEHFGKPFFPNLVVFMSSGPIVALILTKRNAVKEWRELIGPTDSVKARETHPDSLRARYGTNGQRNAFHGSDGDASAKREIRFFFPNATLEENPLFKMEEYLQNALQPTFLKGLTTLCHRKPQNPVVWLADWLIKNNPNKPKVQEVEPIITEA